MYSRLCERLLYGGCVCQCSVCIFICQVLNPSADMHRALPATSLKPLVQALLAELPDDPSSIVINVKSEEDHLAPTNGQKSGSNGLVYDPSLVYILELCTVLALRDEETIAALGGGVAEALQNVMRLASSYHHVIVSRSIFYLLHVLQASYVRAL